MWAILSALSGISSSFFNYVDRHVLRLNGDSTSFSWWFETLRIIVFLFILPFDYFFVLSYKAFFLLILLGVIELFSVYFYMKMHAFSELSISTIVLRLRVVWVPILAFLLIGEKLTSYEYLGIFITFVGLTFVASPRKFYVDKGLKLALLCSIITAILSIVVKAVSSMASASVISIAMAIPFVVAFPLIGNNWKYRLKDFYSKNIRGVALAIFFNAISMYLQIAALRIGPAGKVVAIFQAMSIISVFMGIFFLNEKKDLVKKIVGSIIVLVGILLLI